MSKQAKMSAKSAKSSKKKNAAAAGEKIPSNEVGGVYFCLAPSWVAENPDDPPEYFSHDADVVEFMRFNSLPEFPTRSLPERRDQLMGRYPVMLPRLHRSDEESIVAYLRELRLAFGEHTDLDTIGRDLYELLPPAVLSGVLDRERQLMFTAPAPLSWEKFCLLLLTTRLFRTRFKVDNAAGYAAMSNVSQINLVSQHFLESNKLEFERRPTRVLITGVGVSLEVTEIVYLPISFVDTYDAVMIEAFVLPTTRVTYPHLVLGWNFITNHVKHLPWKEDFKKWMPEFASLFQ
ncbi:hypothetical protein BZA70DRAFT_285109 [Myxozyma melibiosi]|uniref:Uncharacterized protein n=1 Tax=Myxozyma melibiosi TaxID=54550 RepID=A0ABR1EYZ2_9ASCO